MKCLRCGHCCINYAVVILDNPALPLTETNVRFKPGGERCPHLRGDAPGDYSCAVHDHPQYQETPCFDFGQIEKSPEDPCRMGMYVLQQTKGA
jgi:hypothetical protein